MMLASELGFGPGAGGIQPCSRRTTYQAHDVSVEQGI
jgi:hypothetical protein